MKVATLLIVVLANQGYWFGGRPQAVDVTWAVRDRAPAGTLQWTLVFAQTVVAQGAVALPAAADTARFEVTLPPVRVRTHMTLRWRAVDADARQLAEGSEPLDVLPPGLLKVVAPRFAESPLVVVDPDGSLGRALTAAEVKHEVVASLDVLTMAPPPVVVVGRDAWAPGDGQDRLALLLAEAGSSVMVFEQPRLTELAGYGVVERPAPRSLQWSERHALVGQLDPADRLRWLTPLATCRALLLPADAPVVAVAAWPAEVETREPGPVDAAVTTQAVGKGRLVLWQLPLGPWDTDPRSELVLAGALDYLLTRPGPTPPPSARARPDDAKSP